jgi:hypothetical protein
VRRRAPGAPCAAAKRSAPRHHDACRRALTRASIFRAPPGPPGAH